MKSIIPSRYAVEVPGWPKWRVAAETPSPLCIALNILSRRTAHGLIYTAYQNGKWMARSKVKPVYIKPVLFYYFLFFYFFMYLFIYLFIYLLQQLIYEIPVELQHRNYICYYVILIVEINIIVCLLTNSSGAFLNCWIINRWYPWDFQKKIKLTFEEALNTGVDKIVDVSLICTCYCHILI